MKNMAMEYSIYITYKCNIRCPFCYVKSRLDNKSKAMTSGTIKAILKHIKKDTFKKKRVVFLGGEPLIDYQTIEKFINLAKPLNLSFAVYTNGLLLKTIPIKILNLFNVIFVSMDGDRTAQEKSRGRGTYDKVIRNVDAIKSKLKVLLIGRVTVTEKTDINRSVRNLLKHFDAVHWQIVNKPHFNNQKKFADRYRSGIKKLVKFWVEKLEKGKIVNIIPFQAVAASLIFKYPKSILSFRCGSGHELQTIDIDGKVFWCDEYVGNKKALVGDVKKGVVMNYKKHTELFSDCKICEVSAICLGRCRKCLEEYNPEHVRNYCKMTKVLVKEIIRYKKEILKAIKKNNFTLKKFNNIPDCTEETP